MERDGDGKTPNVRRYIDVGAQEGAQSSARSSVRGKRHGVHNISSAARGCTRGPLKASSVELMSRTIARCTSPTGIAGLLANRTLGARLRRNTK